MSKRAILILAKGFPPTLGGVESYGEEIARAYAELGFIPHVITQFEGATGWSHRGGIHVLNVGSANQLVLLWRFARAIRHLPPAVTGQLGLVHATTWRTAQPFLLSGLKAPLAITVHARELTDAPAVLRPLARAVLARARRILVISRASLARCAEVAPILNTSIARVAWNGLTPPSRRRRSPRAAPSGVVRVLIACRLVPIKNIGGALRAVALLPDELKRRVRLTIAGDGPLAAELKGAATALGLDPLTRFLGTVPKSEMQALYEGHDVFLHPQITINNGRGFESFCLAIADAMQYGLAVIAGRDGAPAEYIEDGVTGYCVDGHNPEQIAARLGQLIIAPEQRLEMGRAAQNFARKTFSWHKHLHSIIEIIAHE